MYPRLLNVLKSHSFFLIGPRGTGKSTYLSTLFPEEAATNLPPTWVNLLDPDQEALYMAHPMRLIEQWLQNNAPSSSKNNTTKWIIIDEIQKVPKLLDVVHLAIERYGLMFALTGSSARKLKHGASNLLAGRAFVFHMHPLSFMELGASFDLTYAMEWGTLPKVIQFSNPAEKKRFLRSYAQTYLKEEIQVEQTIRKIEPFRRFLEVAAQSNGTIINFSRLGREANVDSKSVERYFDILCETLIGFYLDPYHASIRKRQTQKPKFYFFDTGICRAIQNTLDVPLLPRSFAYGKAFEHFIILEAIRLNDYFEKSYTFSYLNTKDGAEIDLIIERPGKNSVLIEIKSTDNVDSSDLLALKNLRRGFKNPECIVLSQEKHPRLVDDIEILGWQHGLKRIFNDNL